MISRVRVSFQLASCNSLVGTHELFMKPLVVDLHAPHPAVVVPPGILKQNPYLGYGMH